MKSWRLTFALLGAMALSAALPTRANAGQIWGSCTTSGVAVFENRIHVRCSSPVMGFTFFAVSTSDPQNVLRFLTVLNSARVNNRPINILFDPTDLSGANFGCLNTDCRVARGVEMF